MNTAEFIKRQSQASLVEKYRMIGESEAFLDSMQKVSLAAKVDRPILVIGERGTGKELVAARLHYLSPRWKQPRITINCAAFAENLLESEIFGYERGAFTGAIKTKPGRFELAHGGSLFLDELAQSPMILQEKLLRVLEYGEFERVGGTETLQVDVKVIAATNRDLPTLSELGKFRCDLLDRLSFEVITLPPLRSRKEDIPIMAVHFAKKMGREIGLMGAPVFTKNAIEQLMDYHWPGNVRELKNVIERAVYRGGGETIEEIVFDPFKSVYRPRELSRPREKQEEPSIPEENCGSLPEATKKLELKYVKNALKASQFNQKKAAKLLGISYYQLRRLLQKYEIN